MNPRTAACPLLLVSVFAAACAKPVAAPRAASDGSLAAVAWLAGSWATDDGTTEEHWTAPRGGSMMGSGRVVVGGRTKSFEHLRIAETDGVIAYHALPSGQAPTTFKLSKHTPTEVVFEDPQHDFPQRVIYERLDDDHLAARIEGMKQGKLEVHRWSLRRVSGR